MYYLLCPYLFAHFILPFLPFYVFLKVLSWLDINPFTVMSYKFFFNVLTVYRGFAKQILIFMQCNLSIILDRFWTVSHT